MRILAVDSASKTASAAVLEDNNIITEFFMNAGLTHSQTLAPMIDSALKNSKISLKEIDIFAVTCGPGSFTGLRIGMSTVKGMALVLDKPCVPVSSLRAMAYNFLGESCIVCACMDARREQLYNAIFEINDNKVIRLTEDRTIAASELVEELKNCKDEIKLVGDRAVLCYNNFLDSADYENVSVVPERSRYIKASGLGLAALDEYQKGNIVSAEELTPVYERKV